jgi:hypothetical protein
MGPIQVDNYLYKTIRLIAHAADGRPSGSSLQAGEQADWINPKLKYFHKVSDIEHFSPKNGEILTFTNAKAVPKY